MLCFSIVVAALAGAVAKESRPADVTKTASLLLYARPAPVSDKCLAAVDRQGFGRHCQQPWLL